MDLENPEEQEKYLEARRVFDEADFKVAESLDKALLTLSGGALAVSMTFIKDIARNPPVWKWSIMCAWILFGLTIAVLLLTFYSCRWAYKKQREILDNERRESLKKTGCDPKKQNNIQSKNSWSTLTEYGNFFAIVLFMLGLIFLGIFIWVNM